MSSDPAAHKHIALDLGLGRNVRIRVGKHIREPDPA